MYPPVLCYLCTRGCASSSAAPRASSSVPLEAYCSHTHLTFPEGEKHRGEKWLLEPRYKTTKYKPPKYNYSINISTMFYYIQTNLMFTASNRFEINIFFQGYLTKYVLKMQRRFKKYTCKMIAIHFISKSLDKYHPIIQFLYEHSLSERGYLEVLSWVSSPALLPCLGCDNGLEGVDHQVL